jgi:glycosyltransferase involved in cell wall biosynthesis
MKGSVDMRRPRGIPSEGRMRRVLVVTYDFPPSMAMGAQACAQIARYLPLYRWEPVVLTVEERYGENIGASSGQHFPWHVVRTSVIPHPTVLYRSLKSRLGWGDRSAAGNGGNEGNNEETERGGTLRRWVLSMFLIGDAYTGWFLPAVVAGLKAIRRDGVEHLFSSGPPWTAHLVGLTLSWVSGRPWLAHFRDPWNQGEQWQCKPVSALSRWIDGVLERMIVKRAAFVVCVTDQHTDMFRAMYGDVPSNKFVTVPNGFDEAEWEWAEPAKEVASPGRGDRFVISYAGQLYQARNPFPLFRALRALIEAGYVDAKKVQIELIGWCEMAEGRRVEEMAAECGIGDCVNLRGPRSRTETLQKLAGSDLLLLLAEGLTVQIPGKTYEYLRTGRPILALTSDGAVADLLRRAGGSWVVDPADEKGMVAALREAYGRWEKGLPLPSADQAIVSGFDRRVLAGRIAELFERSVHSVPA